MLKHYIQHIIKSLSPKSLANLLVNDVFACNITASRFLKKLIIGLLFVMLGVGSASGATYYSIANNNWSNNRTWSTSSGGGRVGAGVYPKAGDDVIIEGGHTVTVDQDVTCNNFTLNSGTLILNSSTSWTLTISGNFSQTGGTFNFNSGTSGTSAMNLAGNFSQTSAAASMTTTGAVANGTIYFIGNGIQTISFTSPTGANYVKYSINASSTLQLLSSFSLIRSSTAVYAGQITVNGTIDLNTYTITQSGGTAGSAIFALNSGATLITASTDGIDGSISSTNMTRTFDAGANYVFDGVVNQSTSTSIPTALTGKLTINNPGKIVTLSGAESLGNGGTLDLVAGTFVTGSNLTLATTSTINISDGNMTGTLQGGGSYDVNYIGSSKITSSELSGSGLRNMTINLTTGQVLTLDQNRTIRGILTLTQGTFLTTASAVPSLTNTSTTAIVGGSPTTFIDGPIVWTLPTNLPSGSTYNFPVGNGSTYLPFYLVNPTTSGIATAKVQAVVGASGGTVDGTLISKSNTEYWSLVTTGSFTNSSVSLTRPTAITPFDAVAGSATQTGIYSSLAGNVGTYGVSNSNPIGTNKYFVLAQTLQTITTGTIVGSLFCAGSSVSVPFTITGTYTSGNIFTAQLSNAAGSFATPITIGTLSSTTSGTISAIIPANSIYGTGYRIRVVSSTPAKTGTDNGVNLTINVSPTSPTTTGSLICVGSTATLSASGAASGDKFKWYDAATAGNLLKTSTDNVDNTYTTPILGATTNYWVSIINAGGCEGSRTQVTATYPAVSTDAQTPGNNSWIGYVYGGRDTNFANNIYFGHYTEAETFNQSFGNSSDNYCFPIISNSIARSINTVNFSVRYLMTSTRKGLYTVDLGSDDGSRLTVDGALLYNNWADQAYSTKAGVLLNLNGASSLVYDFYENAGGNQVVFQNLTQVLANTLSTNTTQSIFVGNAGLAISGDTYGTLPTGITLSGTGYQWTYSTTPGGVRTNITGAIGAAYTPSATVAPFNTSGTYYIYRNAVLSSANNVAPNPYVATNESNVATLTVKNVPLITNSVTTLTGFNYVLGYGPSNEQTFTVSGANLVSDISITPSTNYEISTTSGTSYQSTPIILTQTSGAVNTTTIYARLKAGLNAGNYNSEIISATAASAITKNVTCSGVVNTPTITTSVITLNGFTYPYGTGSSSPALSFTVSGNYLVSNIVIAPPTHYEISTSLSSGFQSTSISLPITSGSVSQTTIYVRLAAGLAVGNYNLENISFTSSGAITQNISCNGLVKSAPTITVTPVTLTGFTYTYNSTSASAQQSFTVRGDTLALSNNNVVITPPSDFEISTTSGSGFVSTPITLTPTYNAGTGVYTLATRTIYTRLKIGLGVGAHEQNIAVTSTGATTQNVVCKGNVGPAPTIFNDVSILSGFVYSGAGPSGNQTFKVSGTNLTGPIILTPQANYEISLSSGSGYVNTTTGTTYLSLPASNNTVSSTTIYVRLKGGLGNGNYNLVNIVITSAGAITKSVSCNGTVVNSATLTTSKATLTGFGYLFGTGSSGVQSFSVSGAALGTNALTITPPADYEVSFSPSTGFVPTTSPVATQLSITPTGGKVDPTTIYVRLKAGLNANVPPATYGPENIVVAATGSTALPNNVACTGKVFASPLISASATPAVSCPGSTINLGSVGPDIETLYWSGPNNFYSTVASPNLATNNSIQSMTGTYTVTGNVIVGGNLVTNGDFEQGNISFGSGYGYGGTSSTALSSGGPGGGGEGLYTVVATPQSVHGSFTSNGDHTPAPGTMQMVVNGAPTAGVVVWSQSVPVVPNATYQFTYWEQTVNVTNPINPSQLQLYVNGVAAGPIYTASSTYGTWTQFLYNAAAGSNTVLNLELVNQNTIASGNDFALDDIVFQQILTASATANVLVNANLPASLTISASATTVAQGATVSYTATPTNGGATPTYQWKVGGVNVGTNSSTFSYVPSNNDLVTCTMTSSLSCSGSATSNTITMTVSQPVNYWRGTNGTDWGTSSNWTAGYIPAPGENVVYASTTNSWGSDAINDLVLDQNRTIGSLINKTAKRLVIPAGKGLTVNNTITVIPPVIVPATNPADLIYIYSSSTLANGSLIFHNAANSPVSATVEMYSKAFIDKVTSTDHRTWYKWQYFGIPVSSVVANPTFYGSYVRDWHQDLDSINHWQQLSNSSVLVPFYAYELCQPSAKTFIFKGQLVNSDFYPGLTPYTASSSAPGQLPYSSASTSAYPGQSIFANPYAAAIDIKQLQFGSGTEATVYMYNTGSIDQWTTGGGKYVNDPTTTIPGQYSAVPKLTAGNLMPRQVPSMQAMLVKAMNSSTNATFGIVYNSVVMNNTDPQRVKGESDLTLSTDNACTMIYVASENYSDRMWIFTEPTCKRTFDNGWDGAKMFGSSLAPQLFAVEPDGNYQVNAVDDMNDTQLAFQSGQDVEFELTFTHVNTKRYYPGIYLLDQVENKAIDITETGSKYKFIAESTPNPVNRFKIVTRYYEKDAPDKNSPIKVFSANGMIFVHNLSAHKGEAMIFDIAGHFIRKVQFNPNGITVLSSQMIPGAYVAKCLTETEEVTKRLIVQ